jgi:hypothetical protein
MPYFFLSSLKGFFLGGFFLGRPHNMGYQALAFKGGPPVEPSVRHLERRAVFGPALALERCGRDAI